MTMAVGMEVTEGSMSSQSGRAIGEWVITLFFRTKAHAHVMHTGVNGHAQGSDSGSDVNGNISGTVESCVS